MEDVVIAGEVYVKRSDVGLVAVVQTKKVIVALQRGWNFIGDLYKDGDECVLKNAKNIRRWGTTKGLGELALSGATSDTVLDDAGTVRYHILTEVLRMDVDESKW